MLPDAPGVDRQIQQIVLTGYLRINMNVPEGLPRRNSVVLIVHYGLHVNITYCYNIYIKAVFHFGRGIPFWHTYSIQKNTMYVPSGV
jgi:hypothetical protein